MIGSRANEATPALVAAWQALGLDVELMGAEAALAGLGPADVALARLDVLPTLDGVEEGLVPLLLLERRGVRVLNPVEALLAAHDKLRTARILARARVPHPATQLVRAENDLALAPPLVLKPRFGSWGADVALCPTPGDVRRRLAEIAGRPWFRRHGALAQTALPPPGHDLRVLVGGGRVVGAVERVAGEREWRTNVSCGGRFRAGCLTESAAELALTAAAVTGGDLVGVDLLPTGRDSYVVLELNSAVEFDGQYSLDGRDVYEQAARALGLASRSRTPAALVT